MVFWFWTFFANDPMSSNGLDITGSKILNILDNPWNDGINNFTEKMAMIDGEDVLMQECFIYVGF